MTWFAALAECALRAFVVACVAGAALTAARATRVAIRLHVWTIVLYAALAIPVVGALAPPFRVPVPAWSSIDAPFGVMPGPAPMVAAPRVPAAFTARAVSHVVNDLHAATAANSSATADMLISILRGVYLAGLLALVARGVVGWTVTRRLERRAVAIDDPDVLARAARYARVSGLADAPVVAESEHLIVPIATSVLHPMIVLPRTWRAWDAATLDAVFAHETAHVARRDALTQRVSLVYRALFWLSPFSWWLHRQLTTLAEQASDEAVLHAGINRTTYAEVLFAFFAANDRDRGPRVAWHVAMARGRISDAAGRVERVLAWDGKGSRSLTRFVMVATALAMVPVVTAAATVRPSLLVAPAIDLPPVATPPAMQRSGALAFMAQTVVGTKDRMAPRAPRLTRAQSSAPAATPQPPSASADTQPPIPSDVVPHRMVVFLFDLTTMSSGDVQKSLNAARQFVDSQMLAIDVGTVVVIDPDLRVLSAATSDRDAIRSALDRVATAQGHSPADANPGTSPGLPGPLGDGGAALTNVATSVDAMTDLCGRLPSIPARKALLFFSLDWRQTAPNQAALRSAIRSCSQANAFLYAVNPDGLRTPR